MLVPIITQGDDYSCGPTCVIMVASYYAGRKLGDEEREAIRIACLNRASTSQTRLVKVLRSLGLRVGVRREATIETYTKAFYYERPVIVYHEAKDHWMVAVAESKGAIVCNDPDSSIQVHYSLSDLASTAFVISSRT